MANKLAPYKNPEILQFIRAWFKDEHDNDLFEPGIILTTDDLYDAYYGFCVPQVYNRFRLNQAQFEKTAYAAGIWDLGGRFQQVKP